MMIDETDKAPSGHARRRGQRTSDLMRQLVATLGNENVRVDDLMRFLRRRSFGGVLLILAGLGMLPAVSLVAGLVIVVLGAQMAMGLQTPRLPRSIGRLMIDVHVLKSVVARALPAVTVAERYIRPRWLLVSAPPITNVIGFTVVALALVLMLPLPFSNLPPSIALLLLSVGLVERDGIAIVIGISVAAVAAVVGLWVARIAIAGFSLVLAQ